MSFSEIPFFLIIFSGEPPSYYRSASLWLTRIPYSWCIAVLLFPVIRNTGCFFSMGLLGTQILCLFIQVTVRLTLLFREDRIPCCNGSISSMFGLTRSCSTVFQNEGAFFFHKPWQQLGVIHFLPTLHSIWWYCSLSFSQSDCYIMITRCFNL